jgi:hypothetical protein
MAFVNPIPGKEDEMVNRMCSFRNILQTRSGLVKTFLLKERDGKTLVGVLYVDGRGRVQECDGEYPSAGPEYAPR